MATYSFISFVASIDGPGGTFGLGYGAGNAEEGVTVAMVEDKNTMMIGADGTPMNSLHAGNGGTATVRLLKVSPVNAQLMSMYNYQKQNPAVWGQNVISMADVARGDSITLSVCAFKKAPDLTYAKDGGTVEWTFDVGQVTEILGTGIL